MRRERFEVAGDFWRYEAYEGFPDVLPDGLWLVRCEAQSEDLMPSMTPASIWTSGWVTGCCWTFSCRSMW